MSEGRSARAKRSRVAQPLIMSLGMLTFLVSGSFVVLAVTATGSARPQEWSRLDWMAAGSHYRLCIQREGTGALGCMLGAGAGPVTAADTGGTAPAKEPPIYSIAVIHDAPTPSVRPAARKTPAGAATARAVTTPSPRPSIRPRPSPTPPGDD